MRHNTMERDGYDIHRDLEKQKLFTFQDFIFDPKGGLTAKSLEDAKLGSLDIRFRVLPKGMKLYNKKSGDDRVLVFSTDVETLLSVLEPNLDEWRESEEIACFCAFEITDDIRVIEVQEDVAKAVSLMWCLSAEKPAKDGENGTKKGESGVESSADADTESYGERLMYKRILERSDRTTKTLLDYCFSDIPRSRNTRAILFRNPGSKQGGTLVSINNQQIADFATYYQHLVIPQKFVERLATGEDGYLELSEVPEYTQVSKQRGSDLADGPSVSAEAEPQKVDQSRSLEEPIPNFDNISRGSDGNEAEDAFDDYASIRFTDPPTELTITTTTATAPSQETNKQLSPRPGQPPPPPPAAAQPLYGTVDKSAKRHSQTRTQPLDVADSPGGTGQKPPRPPPVDTMPHDGASHSPVHPSGSAKPSRPSAPPKRKATDRSASVDSINFGSSGNVSLDGKEDSRVPPPRGKGKTTRF